MSRVLIRHAALACRAPPSPGKRLEKGSLKWTSPSPSRSDGEGALALARVGEERLQGLAEAVTADGPEEVEAVFLDDLQRVLVALVDGGIEGLP